MNLSISNMWSSRSFAQKADVENTDLFNGIYIPQEYKKNS